MHKVENSLQIKVYQVLIIDWPAWLFQHLRPNFDDFYNNKKIKLKNSSICSLIDNKNNPTARENFCSYCKIGMSVAEVYVILVVLVWNRVWFLYAGLELDMFGGYTFRKVGSEICLRILVWAWKRGGKSSILVSNDERVLSSLSYSPPHFSGVPRENRKYGEIKCNKRPRETDTTF